MIKRTALALVIAMAALTPAIAAMPPDSQGQQALAVINRLDSEGKGWISAEQFERGRAYAMQVFDVLDANGDGVLSPEEFGSLRDPRRAAEFGRLDLRNQGRVTRESFLLGWNRDLYDALAHGRGQLTAGDLRPGMDSAVYQPPAPAQNAAAPPPPTSTGPCWIPLNNAVVIGPCLSHTGP